MAVCVGENIDYELVQDNETGRKIYLAQTRVAHYFGEDAKGMKIHAEFEKITNCLKIDTHDESKTYIAKATNLLDMKEDKLLEEVVANL